MSYLSKSTFAIFLKRLGIWLMISSLSVESIKSNGFSKIALSSVSLLIPIIAFNVYKDGKNITVVLHAAKIRIISEKQY